MELHTEIGANLHLATLDAVQCTSFALHIDKKAFPLILNLMLLLGLIDLKDYRKTVHIDL